MLIDGSSIDLQGFLSVLAQNYRVLFNLIITPSTFYLADDLTVQIKDTTPARAFTRRKNVMHCTFIHRVESDHATGHGHERTRAKHDLGMTDRQYWVILTKSIRVRESNGSQIHPLTRPQQRHVALVSRIVFPAIHVSRHTIQA